MRESRQKPYKQPLYAWNFNSEQEMLSQGWTNTGVVFSEGKGTFNGSAYLTNKISIPSGTYSVRIKCNVTSFADMFLMDYRGNSNNGTGYLYINAITGFISYSSGIIYSNGIASNSSVIGNNEIIVSGISLKSGTGTFFNTSGCDWATNYKFIGSIDLIEIYEGTLDQYTIKNLYENKRNRTFSPHGLIGATNSAIPILDVSAFGGSIQNRLSGSTTNIELCGNQLIPNVSTDTWWTKDGSGLTITNGVANFYYSAAGTNLNKTSLLTVGKTYRVSYTISNYVGGQFRVESATNYGTLRTANGSYTDDIVAGEATIYLIARNTTGIFNLSNVSIQEVIPSVIPTNVAIVRSGGVNAMSFNGSTSKIDCGSYNGLTGDITVCAWIKPMRYGQAGGGTYAYCIHNAKLITGVILAGGTFKAFALSDASTLVYSAASSLILSKWNHLVFIRKSDGKCTCFINGISSGTVDQNSGIPAAGTANICIGNAVTGSFTFDGLIATTKIYSGILSAQEINEIYSSERRLLNA